MAAVPSASGLSNPAAEVRSPVSDSVNAEQSAMKWTPGSVSEDVEDRRGGGGGFRGGPVSIGVVLVLLVLSLLTGKNFLSLLDSGAAPAGDTSGEQSGAPVQSSPEEAKLVQFVSFVLDDAQHT